ncbi:helix-turn-helix domain-containing protein [Pseudonocardia acaciae]|uniref:helix-turn-helix domain-containing protein n=1 Tax=Pseudonocardia acaciae TaxID=551276 RepID=UPI00048F3205|nr:helix-turn-helix domain-containing protein [Pseudonocardia acaciae]
MSTDTYDKVQALKAMRQQLYADVESDTLTIEQVLEVLGVSRSTYYRLVEEKRLVPQSRLGTVRIPCDQVLRYLEELSATAGLAEAVKSSRGGRAKTTAA